MNTAAAARTNALHYLNHTTDGWDGYVPGEAAEVAAETMFDFLTGTLTFENDIAPHCDEWCG